MAGMGAALSSILRRARARAARPARARELDDELAFHAELLERDLRATGMSELDARNAAHRQLGNRTRIAEASWELLSLGPFDTFARELRLAMRAARRSPGFSITVVLTLALGIGATVTMLSVLDHVLLRPLIYPHDDRLVALYQKGTEGNERIVSYPTFLDWAHADAGFAGMSFVRGDRLTLATAIGPRDVGTAFVSEGFFKLMGTRAELGRTFVPEEERQSGDNAIVLSHDIWVRDFAADPRVIGRVVSLDSGSAVVVGVMPVGFAFPSWGEIWRPLGQILGRDSVLDRRGVYADIRAIGRLAPDIDIARATARLSAVQRRVELEYPETEAKWSAAELDPLKVEVVGDLAPSLWALGGAVSLILLIACVNIANLSAVRGASRGREMAVRLALGASRGQVRRKLAMEIILLAIAGSVLGVLGARAAVGWLRATAPFDLPRAAELTIDGRALAIALTLTVVTALLSGVLPALRGAAPGGAISALLGGRSASAGTRAQARVRTVLTGAQFMLALVLLTGAGLLLQSYRRLQTVNPGFDAHNVYRLTISPPKARYADARDALGLYERLIERLRSEPGVEAAAFVNFMPLGLAGVPTRLEVSGRTMGSDDFATYVTVSEDYQRAVRLPVLRGRWYTADEMRAPGDAVVISESLAKRYWPGANAVGKALTIFRASQARADFGTAVPSIVIGIVSDVRQYGPDSDPDAAVYVPMSAETWPWGTLVVRKRAVAPASSAALLRAVKDIDPALATQRAESGFESVAESLSALLAPRRYLLSLLGAFSASALLLAALGIYGVTSYTVAQRTTEIGVRRALGAAEGAILRMVIARSMAPAVAGCAIGLASTFVLVRFVEHFLFDTSSKDPGVLAAISVLLLGVGFIASYLPARRAARVDPMIALRSD